MSTMSMNLQQKTNTSPLETATPVILLLSGLVFCVVVKLINVVILALGDAVKANYLISKPSYGVNYFWLCEVIFAGFIALGLLSLIRGKRKICSAMLIVSCSAISINTALIKASVRAGHMKSIIALETALKRAEKEPASEPCLSAVMSLYRGRYTKLVDLWNEVQKNKYEPAAGLALSGEDQPKFTRHLVYPDTEALSAAERFNLSRQLLNPWRSISNQCSFIIATVHQLAEATNNPSIEIEEPGLCKLVDSGQFRFNSGRGRIPIGTNGWFQFVSHTFHQNYSIGDISIGSDHEGNYFFSHEHACAGHTFWIGPNKSYASMEDFLTRNTSWHLITDIEEWKASNGFVDPFSETARAY